MEATVKRPLKKHARKIPETVCNQIFIIASVPLLSYEYVDLRS
jgi:hypothetical protein